jgi:hypothetical protein
MIDRTCRTIPNRENRAIGDFTVGGGQTFPVTLSNLDTFTYVGEFSGGGFGMGVFAPKTANKGRFADAAAFNKKVKLFCMSKGTEEARGRATPTEYSRRRGSAACTSNRRARRKSR